MSAVYCPYCSGAIGGPPELGGCVCEFRDATDREAEIIAAARRESAEAMREACAALCDSTAQIGITSEGWTRGATTCAAAIRALPVAP